MIQATTVTGALAALIVLVAALTPVLERAVVGATAPSLGNAHPTSTPGGA